MKLQERSYSTKMLRPKPTVYAEADGSLMVLATAWGQPEHAQRVVTEVVNYVNAAKSDVEVTSPFEFMTCLSDEVNYVRTGVLIANDLLYRGENKMEYFSGVELTVLYRKGSQVAWAHVGGPHILIKRGSSALQPMSFSLDLSSEHADVMAPLPSQLIGLDPTCYVQCGHTAVQEDDQIVLLGCSHLPSSIWQPYASSNLNELSQYLVQERPELPFWLGVVSFTD
jgi:hypothetical protein